MRLFVFVVVIVPSELCRRLGYDVMIRCRLVRGRLLDNGAEMWVSLWDCLGWSMMIAVLDTTGELIGGLSLPLCCFCHVAVCRVTIPG